MNSADTHSATAGEGAWRTAVWFGIIAIFVAASAVLIGAIAGRAVDAIDLWSVAVSAGAVAIGVGASAVMLRPRSRPHGSARVASESLVESLPHASAVIDATGRTRMANQAFRQLFPDQQHAPLSALHRRLGDSVAISHEIDRLVAAAAAGEAASLELPVGDASGQVWRVSAHALPDQSGLALWSIEDCSERRAALAQMDAARGLLDDIVATAPVGIYGADTEGRLVLVNARLALWLGYEPGAIEAAGLSLHDIMVSPPAQLAPYRVGDDRDGAGCEVELRGRDGARFAAVVMQGESPNDGSRIRACAVVRPATPETRSEPLMIRSERRFERMFESAPVGIVLLDETGQVQEANRAWQNLAAPGSASIAGRPITEFVSDGDRDKTALWLERIAGDGAAAVPPLDVTLRSETPAGVNRVATLYHQRLSGGLGGGSLVVHFHEATEQRNLEEQFAQSQKMQAVGQLAGGVAHDFNNLLTAMIGFCDLLLLRHSPGDQSFGDIMQIKQNANRAARLVRQLLAFSRQQTLQPRVLSITDVLGDLTNLLRRLIGANIRLNITHGRDLGLVRVDQGQLEQVVINLAVNARDAMRDGGDLTIRTYNETVVVEARRGSEVVMPGDYVAIEIADNGTGIAPDVLERIFEPFFTTKEVGAGTGLGLSTVYGIVKQTGGQVFVDSVVGEGTKFTIMIPEHEVPAGQEVRKAETPDGPAVSETTGAGTILLVEDEDAVRLFSARALRAKGYKVLEARTGEAALELLAAVDDVIDLMITDAVMPEMDGPTLIKEMRDNRPDLPVICISGYAEETFREKLGESDDIHFLPKPFSLNQLAGKVKEVMSLPAG